MTHDTYPMVVKHQYRCRYWQYPARTFIIVPSDIKIDDLPLDLSDRKLDSVGSVSSRLSSPSYSMPRLSSYLSLDARQQFQNSSSSTNTVPANPSQQDAVQQAENVEKIWSLTDRIKAQHARRCAHRTFIVCV